MTETFAGGPGAADGLTLPVELRRRLASVTSVGAITGAGISAESGIPTYRGEGGVYDDPEEGARTVDALSGPALRRDPDRTWRAIAALARPAAGARPNAAHRALVEIERGVERFVLLTQNVDGLHQQAGSSNVIDIHGSLSVLYCVRCGERQQLPGPGGLAALTAAPRCSSKAGCGGVLRPDVVLFGEMLPEDKVDRLRRAFYDDAPDLVLVVGTSALFPYIAEPVVVARMAGRLTVEVNPEPTAVTEVAEFSLRAPAGAVLPEIARALLKGLS